MSEVEKYYDEDGQVAVLISGGFGAGWSTWSPGDDEFMLMDKGLVEMAIAGASEDEVAKYLKSAIGEGEEKNIPYTGGWEGIYVEFLDKGEQFRVEEYDGAETLITTSSLGHRA